jgi:hypothetical protein
VFVVPKEGGFARHRGAGALRVDAEAHDFLLSGAREDLSIGVREFPTLGEVTLLCGDTGSSATRRTTPSSTSSPASTSPLCQRRVRQPAPKKLM